VLTDRLATPVRFGAVVGARAGALVVLGRMPALVVRRSPRLHGSVAHQRLLSGASASLAVHPTPVPRTGSSRSGQTRFVLAAIAALVGFVWVLQGLGVPIGRGSFMIGDSFWTWAGAALVIAALVYGAWPPLRRR
jgi:hypothetical protein